jgi:hypothetical protein
LAASTRTCSRLELAQHERAIEHVLPAHAGAFDAGRSLGLAEAAALAENAHAAQNGPAPAP